jgi:F0F1-type ATP synthase alpha subunit
LLEFPHGVKGIALNLEEDNVGTVLYGEYTLVGEGDIVQRTKRIMSVPVGPALVGMILALFGQRSQPLKLISMWPVLAIAVVYPASLYLFRIFNEEEWGRLRKLIWPQAS